MEAHQNVSPKGQSLVVDRGRVYDDVCNSTTKASRKARGFSPDPCPSKHRHMSSAGAFVCARCGEPWKFHERLLLQGEVQESKRQSKGRWDRLHDVSLLLDRWMGEPEWKFESRLFAASALGRTIHWLVQNGPSHFPTASFAWNGYQVRKRIIAGRAEFERRLKRAGLLE